MFHVVVSPIWTERIFSIAQMKNKKELNLMEQYERQALIDNITACAFVLMPIICGLCAILISVISWYMNN